jgi:DNA (cytosine-5)-methyltransferase 1
LNIASFFSGAGGLDLGFEQAGFNTVWANEFDKNIWATFEANFPHTHLDRRSILDVRPKDIPKVDGLVGGPPCQSWSEAGAQRGIADHRGQLFFEYMRLLASHKPKFFLAENVSGILFSKNREAFDSILDGFTALGYNVSYGLLRASDYGVPQDRDRVIVVGYRSEFGKFFAPPSSVSPRPTLKDAIWDLRKNVVPALNTDRPNPKIKIANHEYNTGGFSSMFLSRNRVRAWDQPSFTIQASARHAPLHPQAPPMVLIAKDKRIFEPGKESLYRRLSVRECARIQTFPDDFKFVYDHLSMGYKQIGNAVPVEFARRIAEKIATDLSGLTISPRSRGIPGITMRFEDLA